MMDGSPKIGAQDLFLRFRKYVENVLRRYGTSPADLDDLVQEVFLIVHSKGGFVPRTAQPTTWLGSIAGHVALQNRRKRARASAREPLDHEAAEKTPTPRGGPMDDVQLHEVLKRVRRALRALPGTKRAVFVLYNLEGRSCAEIADILKIPVGTVYSRLHSARAEFERRYGSPASEIPLALSDSISMLSLGV